MASRSGVVIGALLLIIVVLAVFLVYAFAIRPAITGYLVDVQNQGVQSTIFFIMQQTAPPSCQVVPLTLNNQTINLVAAECLQQPSLSQ